MVNSMKPGSVIVDLAAATGGNCEYTQAGKVVTTENQVKVIGYTRFPKPFTNAIFSTLWHKLSQFIKTLVQRER